MHPRSTPLAALLLAQILPVFSVVAPCHRGASPVSVRRQTFTTGCWATTSAIRQAQVDFYNLPNSSAVLSYNNTYSPTSTTWLTPTSVLAARVAKLGATFEF